MIDVQRYVTESGEDVFGTWLSKLADNRARAKIAARVARLVAGNFGDCKALREGVSELRIDWGPGYHVYFANVGRSVVLLLCGSDKRRQSANIDQAVAYWKDFKRRTKKP